MIVKNFKSNNCVDYGKRWKKASNLNDSVDRSVKFDIMGFHLKTN